jgi:putative nucleotidyltransferase with HDIG domain
MTLEINQLVKRKLNVSELELGMFVCEVDRPWRETPFLLQGFALLTEEDLLAVQACCSFVYVDELRRVAITLERHSSSADAQAKAKATHVKRAPLSRELRQEASAHHRNSTALINDVFLSIQCGKGIDTSACRLSVQKNLDSMLRNESALLWLTRMKTQDQYTCQHCLSVSVMAMGFGHHLGLERNALEQLGLAGLLHDVGKMQVDQSILNKPGKLSRDEFEHIKNHASFGYQLLRNQPDLPEAVLGVVHGHHERLDGQGYPRQLSAEQIPYFTRIVSIVDCFDAITSHRVYDCARTVKEAFKVLTDMRNIHFDAELVMRFIEWLGIFPVGTLVELHTGEIGLVLEKHPRMQLRPKVVVMIDSHGQRCTPRFIDLAKVSADPQGQPYRITAGLADGTFGLSMADPQVQALLDNNELQSLDDEDEIQELLAHWDKWSTPTR